MYKTFKYRIYPTLEQAILIDKHIGCCRFIYNLSLDVKKMAYSGTKINLSAYDISKQLPDLKSEYTWLKEINSGSLQVAVQTMDRSFINFHRGHCDYPKFKKKTTAGSFQVPQKYYLRDNVLILPKFREGIKIIIHRPIGGIIKSITVSKTSTGKHFASLLCKTDDVVPIKPTISESIGIYLGLKSFLITSGGEIIENPKYLRKSLSKLKYIQSKYSRFKGKRTRKKLVLLHEKITSQRKDFLQKTSTTLIRENQTICIETLKVENMIKNHKLALSISDVGWSMFISMLEYKSNWYGKNLLKIGTFEPSSKMCSSCENVNKELKLSDRRWTCNNCGSILDRDINAAINIKNIALKNNLSVERRLKNQVELPILVGTLTLEVDNDSSLRIKNKEDEKTRRNKPMWQIQIYIVTNLG